jgi:hypothetical protein
VSLCLPLLSLSLPLTILGVIILTNSSRVTS